MRQRVRWKRAAIPTFVGLGFIALGLGVEDFSRSAWSDTFIAAGATIGLLGIVLALEPWLMSTVREVATSTAREEAERTTADLARRVVSLEKLGEAVESEHVRRRAHEDSLFNDVRSGVTVESIGRLLQHALGKGLLRDDGRFHVRCSAKQDCEVVYVLPILYRGDDLVVWFSFEPIGREYDEDGMVTWESGEPADIIANNLAEASQRRGSPPGAFDFAYAIERMITSIEVARVAQLAPAGGPPRLGLPLQLLVNDGWVLSSYGLEAIASDESHEAQRRLLAPGHYQDVILVDTTLGRAAVSSSGGRAQASDTQWEDALTWLREREGYEFESTIGRQS